MAQYDQPQVRPSNSYETVSLGEWIVTAILQCIPIVGFIMLLVWAFGSGAKPSKQNYARAMLIFWLVGAVLCILLSFAFGNYFIASLAVPGGALSWAT
ncbi:MAG: hypothetical protein LBD02_10550 [Christensenellaceae bacterium]|jgi:predicted membrane channel-forming protein YqfA (hemolysin III family)|nr:hypothetical protein [Christensenellaceae bacterium]